MTLWQLVILVVVVLIAAVFWWARKDILEGAREGLQEADEEIAQEKAASEALNVQQAEARRQTVERAYLARSEGERFALNLRAPFTYNWILIFETPSGRPLEYFYTLTPPAGKEDELRSSLKDGWDITDHASAMTSLAWLLNSGGHHASYQEVRRNLQAGNEHGLDRRQAAVVGKWEPEVGALGGLAFDLARAADIAAQGVALGYLSEAQGWRVLGQCRQLARDAGFRDWAQYGQSFLAGAEYWKSGGVLNGVRNKGYAQAVKWLLEDAESPWRRGPWPQTGQGLERRPQSDANISEDPALRN